MDFIVLCLIVFLFVHTRIERFRTMYSIPTILDLSNVHDANEKPNQVTFAGIIVIFHYSSNLP